MAQNVIYWSGDEDELLIEFVKDHEILYNVKSKDFKKIHLKQYLWCEIGGILNKTDVDCRKRWSYVRDYYIRRRGKPGTGGEAAMKRAVLLSFLDGFNSSRRSTAANITGDENSEDVFANESAADKSDHKADNKNDGDSEEEVARDDSPSDDDDDDDDEARNYLLSSDRRNHHQHPPTKKRKWQSWLPHPEERPVVHRTRPLLDETDHFFLSMAQITKKLPRYERAQLRMQIASLVGNAELQHLLNECRDMRGASSDASLHRPGRRPATKDQQGEPAPTKHESILP